MSKQQYYRVGLEGNANYSSKEYSSLFAKLLSKDFFKKFPLAKKIFPKVSESLNNGNYAYVPLSNKALEALRLLNSKVLKAGKRPIVNIFTASRFEGEDSAVNPWAFRLSFYSRWGETEFLKLDIQTKDGWCTLIAVKGEVVFGKTLGSIVIDKVNFLDSVRFSDQLVALLKGHSNLIPTSILDSDEQVLITSEGIEESEEYDYDE